MSTAVLREVYKLTGGKIPIVGCGVSSGDLFWYLFFLEICPLIPFVG